MNKAHTPEQRLRTLSEKTAQRQQRLPSQELAHNGPQERERTDTPLGQAPMWAGRPGAKLHHFSLPQRDCFPRTRETACSSGLPRRGLDFSQLRSPHGRTKKAFLQCASRPPPIGHPPMVTRSLPFVCTTLLVVLIIFKCFSARSKHTYLNAPQKLVYELSRDR